MLAPTMTHQEVKSSIVYVPATGAMIWSLPRGPVKGGSPVGTMLRGERWVRLNRKMVKAAEVAYFWMTGTWKHTTAVNGDKNDLRWENIAVAPEKRETIATNEPYTYLRQLNGVWQISGNMGITIDQIMSIMQMPEEL